MQQVISWGQSVKFLCDRCKTRYSIGEERVRGKILKIRCKNCANVITVREGMPEPLGDDRRGRPTTGAPGGDSAHGALGQAFATQLAKPPPALIEEWYVSIDGQQAGPFSLVDAQRWVASKPQTAELHCWSEGFDDWLPVDKVSHFRGLRKAPPPAAARKQTTIPPPIPAPAPRPLFAATMASIEKSSTNPRLAPLPLPAPVAARANGVPALRMPSEDNGNTEIDKPVFPDAVPQPLKPWTPEAIPPPAKHTLQVPLVDEDDLDIGEVSRVVKLGELEQMMLSKGSAEEAPIARPPRAATQGTGTQSRLTGTQSRLTGTQSRLTGTMPKMSPVELGMNVDPSLAHNSGESLVARSFADRHRRGMIMLIAGSGVVVLGVIALVAFVVSKNTEESLGSLGEAHMINTNRPEDIVRQQAGLPPTTATGSATIVQRPTQHVHRPTTPTQVEEPTGADKLDAQDVEDMAQKQSEGTKRCYMRAQRGTLGLEDLKKIDVTISINKDGSVSDVQLSSHGGDTLGQCLVSRIKGWRFHESRGGTFRFALAFGGS